MSMLHFIKELFRHVTIAVVVVLQGQMFNEKVHFLRFINMQSAFHGGHEQAQLRSAGRSQMNLVLIEICFAVI